MPNANRANISHTGCRPDALANQFRRDDVALEELADEEDRDDREDRRPLGPELRHRDPGREHEPGHGTHIGHEGDDAGDEPDQQSEIQAGDREPERVERPEDQADAGLAAHEGGDRDIDLTRETTHRPALRPRHPAVDSDRPSAPSR